MMDPQQQGTVADAREAPRKSRDAGLLQYKELLASRDAIDRERQKYLELFELSPDACFLTDARGIIREANVAASRLLGVPAQFLAGKTLPGFFEESAQKAYRRQLDRLRESETSDDWEIQLRARNGPADVSVSIARMTAGEKRPAGYRWVIRDISRRKHTENQVLANERKAREEAETSSRIKSDFLSLLSHEFRTPLQAIFGYTELLEREIHGPLTDSQRRYLQRIQQSQQLLLGLIATILDFAKLDSGRPIDTELHPTAVHELLAQMKESSARSSKRRS